MIKEGACNEIDILMMTDNIFFTPSDFSLRG
jgi:hypothetical protein